MKLIQVNRGVAEGGGKGAGNSRGGQICGRLDYLIAKKTTILEISKPLRLRHQSLVLANGFRMCLQLVGYEFLKLVTKSLLVLTRCFY